MRTNRHKLLYPLDLDRIAHDVATRGIDLAPTRQTWEKLARYCALVACEQGRDAFHLMAAVWPDYSRHDSELCYNRALRQSGKTVHPGYLASMLRRHGININRPCYRTAGKPIIIRTIKTQPKTMKKIQPNTMLKTLRHQRPILGRNQLTDLLLRLYPQSRVLAAVDSYRIGFNSFNTGAMGDALIFWQVDQEGTIVNAKRIHYKADGHRDKRIPPMVMYPGNPQCLFGLHLLRDAPRDVPVAIVESEKSALVMSIALPQYLWMACGSLNNFNENFLQPLRDRMIFGFPDLDIKRDKQAGVSVSCAMWRETAKQLRLNGWRIIIDNRLEETATTPQRMDKIDIADTMLDQAMKQQVQRLKKTMP